MPGEQARTGVRRVPSNRRCRPCRSTRLSNDPVQRRDPVFGTVLPGVPNSPSESNLPARPAPRPHSRAWRRAEVGSALRSRADHGAGASGPWPDCGARRAEIQRRRQLHAVGHSDAHVVIHFDARSPAADGDVPPNRKVPTKRVDRPSSSAAAAPATPSFQTTPRFIDRMLTSCASGSGDQPVGERGSIRPSRLPGRRRYGATPMRRATIPTHSCSRSCHAPRARHCSAASRAMSIRPRHASRRIGQRGNPVHARPRHGTRHVQRTRDEDNRLSGMQAQQANREGDVLARVARRGLDEHASGRHTMTSAARHLRRHRIAAIGNRPATEDQRSAQPSPRLDTGTRALPRVGTQHGARTLGRLAKPARRQHEHTRRRPGRLLQSRHVGCGVERLGVRGESGWQRRHTQIEQRAGRDQGADGDALALAGVAPAEASNAASQQAAIT